MTELADAGIPVTVTCRVLQLSRQPYCRRLAKVVTTSEVVEAYRANALFDAHRDDPEFVHRLLADEARNAGEAMSDRTAWRIASANGWWSAFGKKSRLAVQAIENAVQMRGDVAGCVVHSDRGTQFRSRKFLRALARHRMVGSMGRVGSSGDNSAKESFFALLQKNVLDRRSWTTRKQLRIAIVTWIERTYHRRRRQARLGRLTPIEFETIMTKHAALAA